ncbi:hypothetical protein AB4Z34_13425 [Ensifer sp. 2YAB10]|uniref:hypothetical protein n=1 Tax=Ensifer TaxID=106591 RepID=UPI000DE22122|nr:MULTISPECIES: hypothetical protein [Ensifer]MBK5568196.1 hypothetical protein [Ensifer sp. SSB1]MBZ7920983.1 hypothetical protein [Ensifer adhaerens]UAX93430.1 hypothetical protein LAC78_04150 [Ensifer adhaerens]UAY01067.1 hypothetical protein LAC80_04155 [Ensifer adhaerens]UAY08448.1 hypothetical protein LAC81_04155 [Ensifer adhaerens]
MLLALTLLTSLLGSPQSGIDEKPKMPDYFKNQLGGSQPQTTICNLNGQDSNGQFKTCRYDCGTQITVGERFACPFIMQR